MENYKKWLTKSNITTALMLVFVLAMLVSPQFKGVIIQGLMKIGLFQPSVPGQSEQAGSSVLASAETGESIQFEDKEGKILRLADLKGKVVFVNFWATWCPPCIAEMPSINKLQDKFKDDPNVVFIMLDMDSDLKKSLKFMERKKYDLDVYIPASQIPGDYFQGALPTTLLFDKAGRLVFKHEGGADYNNSEFEEFVKKIISD